MDHNALMDYAADLLDTYAPEDVTSQVVTQQAPRLLTPDEADFVLEVIAGEL